MNRIGDIAAESGRIPKGAFVRWAMQLLSVTVQRGNAEMYRRSGRIISRKQGLHYDASSEVPVLKSCWDMNMLVAVVAVRSGERS